MNRKITLELYVRGKIDEMFVSFKIVFNKRNKYARCVRNLKLQSWIICRS